MAPMRSITSTVSAILLTLAFSACGGGDQGASLGGGTDAVDPVLGELKADGHDWDSIERYPDGSLKALGNRDAQGRPHGEWRWWHPAGGRWWEATYVAGAFDPNQPWTLYNPDGSTRSASGDGSPPEEPPL